MAENPKEWPRCHTCLYNWCPRQSDECKRCDVVIAIITDDAKRRRIQWPENTMSGTR